MPTKPIEEIIPRTYDNPKIEEAVGKIADVIDETVNFGSHVFKWHLDSATGGDETVPITLLFRHILEIIDSVAINVRHSSTEPCKLLLRGLLESLFGLTYILKNETEKRAMAFMTTYAMQRLKYSKKLDLSTEQGKQFQKQLNDDPLAKTVIASVSKSNNPVKSVIANLEALLKKDNYIDAVKEYERTKKAGQKNPNWYSLYDGPKNMEKLAEHLKLAVLYQVFYRLWSNAVHGTDIIVGKISRSSSGHSKVLQIRLPLEIENITSLTISFAYKLYRMFIERYCPDKLSELNKWYKEEIRDMYLKLSRNKIIKINVN